MTLPENGQLLRIYISENDRHAGKPLYEWIIHRARAGGLAGCTVLRGVAGYGAHSRLHTAKILALSSDLPLVVEIVDTADKISGLLQDIDDDIADGLATIENVKVHWYRSGRHA